MRYQDLFRLFIEIYKSIIIPFIRLFQSTLFRTDMKLVNEPLMYHVSLITTAEQKNFFDLLHFSPLKVCRVLRLIIHKIVTCFYS